MVRACICHAARRGPPSASHTIAHQSECVMGPLDSLASEDITLLPERFVAHGIEAQGGIFNKPMDEGFAFADVAAAMESATVVMLNAGFLVPSLARISLAMLEASQVCTHTRSACVWWVREHAASS